MLIQSIPVEIQSVRLKIRAFRVDSERFDVNSERIDTNSERIDADSERFDKNRGVSLQIQYKFFRVKRFFAFLLFTFALILFRLPDCVQNFVVLRAKQA